jgi:hypothetical protein
LWRINQIKNWVTECIDHLKIVYPHCSRSYSWTVWEEKIEHEIGHFWYDEGKFAWVLNEISKIDIKKEILELLKQSFEIEKQIKEWKLNENYEMYFIFLRQIFYKYIENLDDKLVTKDFYNKIVKLKSKYEDFYLNFKSINKKFWIKEDEFLRNIENSKKGIKDKDYSELRQEIKELKSYESVSRIFSHSCIIICEWEADNIYLDRFFNEYFKKQLKPLVIPAFGCGNIKGILFHFENIEINKPILGILDFDGEWIKWFEKFNDSRKYFLYSFELWKEEGKDYQKKEIDYLNCRNFLATITNIS